MERTCSYHIYHSLIIHYWLDKSSPSKFVLIAAVFHMKQIESFNFITQPYFPGRAISCHPHAANACLSKVYGMASLIVWHLAKLYFHYVFCELEKKYCAQFSASSRIQLNHQDICFQWIWAINISHYEFHAPCKQKINHLTNCAIQPLKKSKTEGQSLWDNQSNSDLGVMK